MEHCTPGKKFELFASDEPLDSSRVTIIGSQNPVLGSSTRMPHIKINREVLELAVMMSLADGTSASGALRMSANGVFLFCSPVLRVL